MKLFRLPAFRISLVLGLMAAAGAGGYVLAGRYHQSELCFASYRATCDFALRTYGVDLCAEALLHQDRLLTMEEHRRLLRKWGPADDTPRTPEGLTPLERKSP